MNIFKETKKAGIVWVMEEAAKSGFSYGDNSWINFGQGAAEAGNLSGGIRRPLSLANNLPERGYSPVAGRNDLRSAVAGFYNELFRGSEGKKYSPSNINIAGGGRVVLTRFLASLGTAKIACYTPDYSAYDGLLKLFPNLRRVSIFLDEKENFALWSEGVRKQLEKKKPQVLLFSQPANPTGRCLSKKEWQEMIAWSRAHDILLVVDEFYFNYIYGNNQPYFSVAELVKNPDKDGVLVISGLSKAWRCSGWRLAWALGPSEIISQMTSVGSFLDGGASHPVQKEALSWLSAADFKRESAVMNKLFSAKRDYLLSRLRALGFEAEAPQGAFYVWAKLDKLPRAWNQDLKFFRAALKNKIIVVPGRFFDISSGQNGEQEKFQNYVRFSYGPELEKLKTGLDRLKKMIKSQVKN